MIDIDQLRERIREHATEASDCDTLCGDCGATLTETDRAAGECTQCRAEANSEGTDE
jgi:hypothetical protein